MDRQALTWHNWDHEAAEAFGAVAAVDPSSAGMLSIAQLLHGCHLARIGESSMLAVRPFNYAGGALHWDVAGGVSLRPGAVFRDFAPLESAARAAGASVLSFITPHAAMARVAGRNGYKVAGWVLRNDLGAH